MRAAALAASLLAAGCAFAQPAYRISAAQVQEALAQRFPVRRQAAGLLDLQVEAPALRFMGRDNRLGAAVPLQLSGPALGRSYAGSFDLDFALRYEPADRTIRAHQVKVNSLDVPQAPAEIRQLLAGWLPQLANQAVGEVVLHQVQDKDLALADTLGLEPDRITVTDAGLTVGFGPKK